MRAPLAGRNIGRKSTGDNPNSPLVFGDRLKGPTGTNWEGRGVIPDVSILQEQAFREAYSMALKSMIGGSGETTGLPNWLAEEAQAALKELEIAGQTGAKVDGQY